MNSQSCQFLITDAGASGFASKKVYGATDHVDVRDLTTQAFVRIRADEVSPYRHTLYLNGKLFRILNILKQGELESLI